MRYLIKLDGKLGKGVLVTDSYLEAMKEISAGLRNGHIVIARSEGASAPERRATPVSGKNENHSQ